MSLLFNMLSKFVIAFLPKNKHLLIWWLQSPSEVILEHKKISFSLLQSKLQWTVLLCISLGIYVRVIPIGYVPIHVKYIPNIYLYAAAKSLQSCPTLCYPIDGSPPCSPIPGILQARTLEWVAISFSNAWRWKVKVKSLSRVRLFTTPWTAAYQASPSMGFSRQEYWSGLPLPSLIYLYTHVQ